MNPKAFTLSNGIQVITDHMSQIESISLRVLYKAGSRHETEDNAGIAHCIEHMNFKGTTRYSAKQIAEELDMVGGYLNAYTGRERTVYYAKILKNDLPVATDIISDILYNSIYDEEELKKEKNVILQEIAEAHDNPDDAVFDLMQEITYSSDTIGKPIAGNKESVLSINSNKIKEFLNDFYQPNNMIIGISGNFDENKILDVLETKFGQHCSKIHGQTKIVNRINVLEQNSENTELELKQKSAITNSSTPKYHGGNINEIRDIEQAHVILAFAGASYKAEDYYLQQIAALIAGGGMSSRLFQEIREKRGLAYSIGAFCSSYTDCGIWGVHGITGQKELNELIEVTIDQLLELSVNIEEEELSRAKAQIKSGILMAQESSSSRSERIISNYAIFNKFISLDEIMRNIDNITRQEVANKIKEIIQTSDVSFIGLGNVQSILSYDKVISKLKI